MENNNDSKMRVAIIGSGVANKEIIRSLITEASSSIEIYEDSDNPLDDFKKAMDMAASVGKDIFASIIINDDRFDKIPKSEIDYMRKKIARHKFLYRISEYKDFRKRKRNYRMVRIS